MPGCALAGQGAGDFIAHPFARHRLRRENDQQLVIDTDGFIDAPPELIADLEVFWREPAAHVVGLQVVIEAAGEVLILAGIADEAAIIFDGAT